MNNKKLISLVLVIFLLAGCYSPNNNEAPNSYYYVRSDYLHAGKRTVFVREERISTGVLCNDLDEYLQGPKAVGLVSPFPDGTHIVTLDLSESSLCITLSNEFASLSGIQLSVACGALAQTCFSLTEVQQLEIRAEDALLNGQEILYIPKGAFLLKDNSHKTKE